MEGNLKQIVVALDNSRFALNAVEWGARLAKASEAKLIMIHVLETRYLRDAYFAEFSSVIGVAPVEHAIETYQEAFRERGQNILAAGEEVCRKIGIRPECKLEEGVFYEISRDIAKDADLLILGRRGDHSNFGFHLLGAEGERVIRHVNCACLVVPETYCDPKKIIVGVHESGPSRAATQWADYLYQTVPSTKVRYIHVRESKPNTDSTLLEDLDIGENRLEVFEGDPEKVLVDACSVDSEMTLCAIGATGHKRSLKELILGTVSYHLLHKIKGPVLLAR